MPSNPDTCVYCGEPTSAHQDFWGRWVPCFESILGTLLYEAEYGSKLED